MKNNLISIKDYIKKNGLDAVLLTSCENVYYVSGFVSGVTGDSDARLLVTCDESFIITDSRYTTYAKSVCPEFELIEANCTSLERMSKLIEKLGVKKVAFENQRITFASFGSYFAKLGAELVPLNNAIEDMRIIKSDEEITSIKKACDIATEALKRTIPDIKVGVSELQIAALLEYNMRCLGAERTSFGTIVVSGERSAMPHGIPSEKLICDGDPVTIDFGAVYNGYCSDMTRTFFVGTPSDKMAKIYETVLQAQLKAIESYKSGMECADLDAVARKHISFCGYGQYFGHSLGHGVGIEIHEAPSVSPRSKAHLKPGMVFSVEPGIYVEGVGGARIEDLVCEKDGKLTILTEGTGKELTVL